MSFYQKNRSLLLSKMKKGSISLFFSNLNDFSLDLNFALNKNFHYLTGIEEDNSVLLIIKDCYGNEESFLFLKYHDVLKQKWDGESLSFEKASNASCIPLMNILNIDVLNSFLTRLLNTAQNSKYGLIENFYLDLSNTDLNNKFNLSLLRAEWIQKNYPYINIYDSCNFLINMRVIKNETEIDLIKKAIAFNDKALRAIAKVLKPGMYEYQISAFYHYFLANHDLHPSFNTIIASGKNAIILHYNKQKDLIKQNDLVLLDLGVKYNNYASDISFCFPASGKFTSQQKIIYDIVLEVNRKIIEWIRPGYTFQEMNQFGKDILKTRLQKNGFMKVDENIEKYCYHGLGHYLGLDVHDVGNVYEPIKENSVITVEPGLYFEELNLGIRIEDNILIKKDGNINLTKNIPRKTEDIELLMIQE
ncbi:hypothetical protein CWO85_00250 [Candidatus Phytoplasma ziziphi]|uniref:Xaa-Pro aminopeptidase n=1 Tax=Ziziphus jujuba witches'-broom phytoplasma TaxID=135727 RepID=A0A660HLP8_ZIZJU|nr:aminopeptidase P N-terminal domain-containing protein [Candidatus Phytoplasma ziziphi]AYJ00977.1 hypothetical protein CWO85_00250 [Candidatus Phytoplasma ziziphi]